MYSAHLSDMDIERLFRFHQTDMGLVHGAKQLCNSLFTLQAKIKKLGVKRTPQIREEIGNKLFKELLQIYKSSWSLGKIGWYFDINVNTIYYRLKKFENMVRGF